MATIISRRGPSSVFPFRHLAEESIVSVAVNHITAIIIRKECDAECCPSLALSDQSHEILRPRIPLRCNTDDINVFSMILPNLRSNSDLRNARYRLMYCSFISSQGHNSAWCTLKVQTYHAHFGAGTYFMKKLPLIKVTSSDAVALNLPNYFVLPAHIP